MVKETQCRRCRFDPWVGTGNGEGNSHSSVLAWRIPWTEEPGVLLSMGLQEESDRIYQLNNNLRVAVGCLVFLYLVVCN